MRPPILQSREEEGCETRTGTTIANDLSSESAKAHQKQLQRRIDGVDADGIDEADISSEDGPHTTNGATPSSRHQQLPTTSSSVGGTSVRKRRAGGADDADGHAVAVPLQQNAPSTAASTRLCSSVGSSKASSSCAVSEAASLLLWSKEPTELTGPEFLNAKKALKTHTPQIY